MIKNRKAGVNWKVLMLVFGIIAFFILLVTSTGILGKSKAGINYVTLDSKIEMCRLNTGRAEASGDGGIDTDEDGFIDSCDVCLGVGADNGQNDQDADNDGMPDDCDEDPGDDDKHNCKDYQLYDLEEEEYLDQCCTEAYANYLSEENTHLGLNAQVYICKSIA